MQSILTPWKTQESGLKNAGILLKKNAVFVIEKNQRLVGSVDLRIDNHKAELGYWLGKKYWNKGIMTEAVSLIVQFGFKKLKLRRIYAYSFSKNKKSMKVLEKSKFRREGFLQKDRIKDGKLIDVYLYARIK